MAFAMLAQERHNQFHTVGDHKIGDESNFADCKNELCCLAFNLLKDSRSMAVEVSDFTIQLVADYKLTIQNQGRTVRAWMEHEPAINSQSTIITPEEAANA